jgi:hypothetical protein
MNEKTYPVIEGHLSGAGSDDDVDEMGEDE